MGKQCIYCFNRKNRGETNYESVSSLSKNAYNNHLRYPSNSFGMAISYRSNCDMIY